MDENAGLRALMGEEASDVVREVRETEDGVNRALLLAAVEEITTLKTRVAVLESEAARHKVNQGGYGGIASMIGGGGSGSGVDAAQMQKLTRELARLEENNSRMTWMLGEKEKQIKEVRPSTRRARRTRCENNCKSAWKRSRWRPTYRANSYSTSNVTR